MPRVHFPPTSVRSAAIDTPTRGPFVRLAVALLFIAAQVLGLVHLAHVRHTPCVEHGGMRHVEGGHGGHASLAPGAFVFDAPDATPQAGRSASEGDHGHEDCDTCAREREPGLPATVVELRAPVRTTTGVARRVGPGRTAVDQAGRWRLAPKQGPPTLG